MSGQIVCADLWAEDPLPIPLPDTAILPPSGHVGHGRSPRQPKPQPFWTHGRKAVAGRLLRSLARMTCRCTGRTMRCHPCRARRLLEES